MFRDWAKASACRLQITLSCAFLCHIVSLQYLSRSSLHRLAGHLVVFSCHGLQVLIISMTFVLSLTQMLVFLSLYVMLSILLSILVCAAASLFCACLVSVQVSTPCHSWQHTGCVHLSVQADGKAAFEDVPVFGVCRPACHDTPLYIFDLVHFLEAVVLSQVLQPQGKEPEQSDTTENHGRLGGIRQTPGHLQRNNSGK